MHEPNTLRSPKVLPYLFGSIPENLAREIEYVGERLLAFPRIETGRYSSWER